MYFGKILFMTPNGRLRRVKYLLFELFPHLEFCLRDIRHL